MATGSGSTLGAALTALFAQDGPRRTSYDRQGWRAQFSQLSSTRAGYAALERAGLSASTRTQRGWLTGDVEASKANREHIAEAYRSMQGGFDRQRYETAQLQIRGQLTQGTDTRMRGYGRSSPLRLQFPGDPLTDWSRIADEWNGQQRPDELERLFVADVVEPILGAGSHPWQFDGNRYEVII